MKKINVFLSLVVCLGAFLAVGCSEQDEIASNETAFKSVEVCLEAQKSSLISVKSGALEGDYEGDITNAEEVPYCDGEFAAGNYVVATYDVDFYANGAAILTSSYTGSQLTWTVGTEDDYTDKLSGLLQLDYPETATSAKITITDFRVYEDDSKEVLKFITPTSTSAYADYVDTPVEQEFEIDLYEKQYMLIEVLCFNEEDIPEFGFAWSDFDLVTADEICCFFNCMGIDSAGAHQVMAADLKAKFYTTTGSVSYWEGQNYDDKTDLYNPNCIPCPGNWETAGGFVIEVTPKNDTEEVFEIALTADQITLFLESTASTWVYDTTTPTGSGEIDFANGVPFIHFTFDTCFE